MIHASDPFLRRILTFPAVHPCDSVSPTTLLASLTNLAREISLFKSNTSSNSDSDSESRSIVSSKRSSASAIRLTGVLLVFLEELEHRVSDSNPDSNSVVISLSEIHVALQKLRFLLEDCTRRDARVWMLLKSGEVASHFGVAGRDLATALEIFPVRSLVGLSDESRDCVEFVARQARGLGSVVESGVCWALSVLIPIIKGFQRKVIPDPNGIKQVLDYLGVRNWVDCEGEIRFLEEEICGKENSSGDTNMSSLLGFMMYCRCVVFSSLCGEGARRNESEVVKEDGFRMLGYLNEEDLRCPISLEIMTDPVTISTGHTYDRSSIRRWFKAGNPSCPTTGEMLEKLEWVPNEAVRRLAGEYARENGIEVPRVGVRERCVLGDVFVASPGYEEAIKMACDYLAIKIAIGKVEERNKAACEVRLLTKRNVLNRALFVESGMVPYLLNLLLLRDPNVQENAIAALLNLTKHSKGKVAVVRNGGLQVIVKVLKNGMKLEARQHAAAVLFYLSSTEENRHLIGSMPEAIPALVELIRVGGDRGKKNALIAIFGLVLHPSNHNRVLGANAVPLLADLLRCSEKEDLITDALAVLSALAEKPEGAAAVLRAGTLNIVVAAFCSSDSRSTREHCASLLQALCMNGGRDVVQVLARNPLLMGSLYSLLTEGTPRAGKKARSLIGILHEFSEKGSSSLAEHPLPREHFIHAW